MTLRSWTYLDALDDMGVDVFVAGVEVAGAQQHG